MPDYSIKLPASNRVSTFDIQLLLNYFVFVEAIFVAPRSEEIGIAT